MYSIVMYFKSISKCVLKYICALNTERMEYVLVQNYSTNSKWGCLFSMLFSLFALYVCGDMSSKHMLPTIQHEGMQL